MKINSSLLALCAFHPNVWGATAFVPSPTSRGPRTALSMSTPSFGPSTRTTGTNTRATGLSPLEQRSGTNLAPKSAAVPNSATRGKKFWDTTAEVTVQGGSLKTWSFPNPSVQRVQVVLRTDGRPCDADVDLWQGPDNTPQKMRVYLEDGSKRPFNCIVETPRGPNTIAIRNIAQMEFPIEASVVADAGTTGFNPYNLAKASNMDIPRTVQGGALKTFPFDPSVASVQVLLATDGRPLNSRIELLQGPNNNKQVIEVYCEDGMDRPFYCILETPGSGNVIRVVNTATMEFPLSVWVEPYEVGAYKSTNPIISDGGPTFGGGRGW